MALNNPDPQKLEAVKDGRFTQTWYLWFLSIVRENSEGFTGSFTNGDGDTVTVVNGKITDVN